MAPLKVFCLEGDWDSDLRRSSPSIRSLIDLMSMSGQVKAVYRDVATVAELEHYLAIWLEQKRYADYRVGWLAFHGGPGYIKLGRKRLDFAQLAEVIGPNACTGRALYLGSCETAHADQQDLAEFRHRIGAHTVCGFRKQVDWIEAAAFELLLMQALGDRSQRAASFKLINREYGPLAARLGFISDPPWSQPRV